MKGINLQPLSGYRFLERQILIHEPYENVFFTFLTTFEVPDDDFADFTESCGSRFELECMLQHQFVRIPAPYTEEQKTEFRCKLLNTKGVRMKYMIFRECKTYISTGNLFIKKISIPAQRWESFIKTYPESFRDDLLQITPIIEEDRIACIYRDTVKDRLTEERFRFTILLMNFLYPIGIISDTGWNLEIFSSQYGITSSKSKK